MSANTWVSPKHAVFEQLARRPDRAVLASCLGRSRPPRRDAHRGRRHFSGQTRDGRYCRARYYHPGLQRFITEDPLGLAAGDVNLYGYAANNPLAFRDPTGQSASPLVGVGLVAAGAVSAVVAEVVTVFRSGGTAGGRQVAAAGAGAFTATVVGGYAALRMNSPEAGGAIGGAAGEYVKQSILTGGTPDQPGEIILAAALGAGTGLLGNAVSPTATSNLSSFEQRLVLDFDRGLRFKFSGTFTSGFDDLARAIFPQSLVGALSGGLVDLFRGSPPLAGRPPCR